MNRPVESQLDMFEFRQRLELYMVHLCFYHTHYILLGDFSGCIYIKRRHHVFYGRLATIYAGKAAVLLGPSK